MSSENPKSVGWHFVLQWIAATTASVGSIAFIGSLLIPISKLFYIVIFLFSGLIIGYAQSLVLKNYVGWYEKWKTALQIVFPSAVIRMIPIAFIIGITVNFLETAYKFPVRITINIFDMETIQIFPSYIALYTILVAWDIREYFKEIFVISKLWVLVNVVALVLNPFVLILGRFQMSDGMKIMMAVVSIGLTFGFAQGIVLLYDLRKHLRIAGLNVPETISEVI